MQLHHHAVLAVGLALARGTHTRLGKVPGCEIALNVFVVRLGRYGHRLKVLDYRQDLAIGHHAEGDHATPLIDADNVVFVGSSIPCEQVGSSLVGNHDIARAAR